MMKQNNPNNPSGIPLTDDLLEQVTGGSATEDSGSEMKYTEFYSAWDSGEFPQHGWTRKQRDGLLDQWESEGFPGTPSQWLSKFKTW